MRLKPKTKSEGKKHTIAVSITSRSRFKRGPYAAGPCSARLEAAIHPIDSPHSNITQRYKCNYLLL